MIKNVEKLENSMVKLTIEADAKAFEEQVQKAYLKNKKHISIPGFRKGKVPRVMIERTYGKEVFYEEAANELIPLAYMEAKDESKLELVSRPTIDVVQIEKGKPFIFTAEVAVKPELSLGLYKGIEVELEDSSTSDEDVEEALKEVQEKNGRLIEVTDRPVKDADTVNIDFEGFIDGKAFDGGKAQGHDLLIGSSSFIDNFEEQLIGKNIGEEIDVNVTFPEDYNEDSLAGKKALFKVKINGIKFKELPELNDEFAEDVSDYDTLDEYRAHLRETLEEKKKEARNHEKEEKVLAKIVGLASVEIPEPMLEFETEQMVDEFSQRLSMQGIDINTYMQFTGGNMATFMDSFKGQAEEKIKTRLTIEAIAKAEKIKVLKKDLNDEFKVLAEKYDMKLKDLKELPEERQEPIKDEILARKVLELIVAEAVEK